jgi:hypothetical protein
MKLKNKPYASKWKREKKKVSINVQVREVAEKLKQLRTQ